jgi:integrase/recombinase XerD
VTHLRKITLEELERRNYSETTTQAYLHAIEDFACYFKRPPDQLGPEEIRQFTAHLFHDRKLADNTVGQRVAALRFFYTKTLKRAWNIDETPYPKRRIQLPTILSQDEVARLIDAASSPFHHTILMTLYGTGVRRAELTHLKITDIDSSRMVIHIQGGKGRKDRDVMLSPNLLIELREHYRSLRRKPETWLFPGGVWHTADDPISNQTRLARLSGGRPTRQYPETVASAYSAALLRHSSTRERYRPAHDSNTARPQ